MIAAEFAANNPEARADKRESLAGLQGVEQTVPGGSDQNKLGPMAVFTAQSFTNVFFRGLLRGNANTNCRLAAKLSRSCQGQAYCVFTQRVSHVLKSCALGPVTIATADAEHAHTPRRVPYSL